MEAGAGFEPSDLVVNEPRELPLLYPAEIIGALFAGAPSGHAAGNILRVAAEHIHLPAAVVGFAPQPHVSDGRYMHTGHDAGRKPTPAYAPFPFLQLRPCPLRQQAQLFLIGMDAGKASDAPKTERI